MFGVDWTSDVVETSGSAITSDTGKTWTLLLWATSPTLGGFSSCTGMLHRNPGNGFASCDLVLRNVLMRCAYYHYTPLL